ncbi:MAG: hypothetical protein RI884_2836 [Pseudomonadota bacterium]
MALEVIGVSKRFAGVRALDDVSMAFRAGEICALLGENGAGKSTLIKILSGLYTADAGRILIDDAVLEPASVVGSQAAGIQTVHQELELAPALSVEENLFMGRLPLAAGRVDWPRLRREAQQALLQTGAQFPADIPVSQLGVSDQQLVEITRALIRGGKILILDEPTAALPPAEVKRLLETVLRLRDAGMTIIYVTHRLDEVLQIADRAIVLRDGRKVAECTRDQLDRSTLVRHIIGRELETASSDNSPAAGEVLLKVEHLACGSELQELSFEAKAGEVLGFFGLLGAGQACVAPALAGVRAATARAISMGARTTLPANPREAIDAGLGFVPIDRKVSGLALSLSVMENIAMPNWKSLGSGGRVQWRTVRDLAERVIARYRVKCADSSQKVAQLSGGNQQKIAISKWSELPLNGLLVEEPTRGVDVGARPEIYAALRQHADRGGYCILTSSDPGEIASLADRVIVMRNGRAVSHLRRPDITEASLMTAAL